MFGAVGGCLLASKGVASGVKTGVGLEQVKGADDTMFGTGEVQFWVGHGGAGGVGLEQTRAVLGVVGGDTTV